jgi:hypothetical protein
MAALLRRMADTIILWTFGFAFRVAVFILRLRKGAS